MLVSDTNGALRNFTFFFFNDTATTEIYTLSLHDALPICGLTIDGADNYNNSFGEFFGSLETKNFTIPLDAVQEFQVVTNGFAPEFGRSTGGLINLVTKSGTNDLHGTAFYSYRGDKLTADDALGV